MSGYGSPTLANTTAPSAVTSMQQSNNGNYGISSGTGKTRLPTIDVQLDDEQEQKLLRYAKSAQMALTNQYSLRSMMEYLDRQYNRECDWDEKAVRAKIANMYGDKRKLQDVTVPIVMPQVEAAQEYMVNVFLSGYPIFAAVADPQYEQAAMMINTIVGENAETAGWAGELQMFFRDGLKYNLAAVECMWDQQTVISVETDPVIGTRPKKQLWEGNRLNRMDLYNTFWDPRCTPNKIHEQGEYVGYNRPMSRIQFKKFMNDMFGQIPPKTVVKALQSQNAEGGASSTSVFAYYQPLINPYPFMQKNNRFAFDWMSWATDIPLNTGTPTQNVYIVTKLYMRITPRDFGLKVPEPNTPQVWIAWIVNGQVIIKFSRQGNFHNFIPVFFAQPITDGMDYQTKSFAQNVTDMQDVATSVMKGYTASIRRHVGDRVLYDPSRVSFKDINNPNPEARIPVRNSAYGKPLNEAVYPFPFRDDSIPMLLQGVTTVTQMANLIQGQNPATQGQFVPGNKTVKEFTDTMGNGNGRNMLMAMNFEQGAFIPLKQVIKLNILQYQNEGILYNSDTGTQVQIDPITIRKASVHFKMSDGMLPESKVIGSDEFQTVIQQLASSPQLSAVYNLGPMFSYLLETQGLDVSPFEKSPEQMQYEQALNAWQQAAETAAKNKAPFNTPMPQASQQLQQQMQQNGSQPQPSKIANAAEQTTGS